VPNWLKPRCGKWGVNGDKSNKNLKSVVL